MQKENQGNVSIDFLIGSFLFIFSCNSDEDNKNTGQYEDDDEDNAAPQEDDRSSEDEKPAKKSMCAFDLF